VTTLVVLLGLVAPASEGTRLPRSCVALMVAATAMALMQA
jgi:hypothetical protein